LNVGSTYWISKKQGHQGPLIQQNHSKMSMAYSNMLLIKKKGKKKHQVGFEVLTAVVMKNTYWLVGYNTV
jgi:hypothetical protein